MRSIVATVLSGDPDRAATVIRVPFNPPDIAAAIEKFLVPINERYFRSFGPLNLLDTDIEYGGDPDELWLPAPVALDSGIIDCEDASAWTVANDRCLGVPSRIAVYSPRYGLAHVVVARPIWAPRDGIDRYVIGRSKTWRIVDPSRAIGM